MTEQQALLAAIRDNPDDDTPRLVYADWLDENAASDAALARAEFIRLQIEWPRLSEADERHAALAAREKQLLAKYRDAWLPSFPPQVRERLGFGYQRGFVRGVSLSAWDCRRRVPPCWDDEPVADVGLRGGAGELGQVIARGWFDGVWGLDIRPNEDEDADDLAVTLASAKCATGLRELQFWSDRLHDLGAAALAGSAGLRNLRCLNVRADMTAGGWERLVNSPVVEGLDWLLLGQGGPWQRGAAAGPVGPRGGVVLAAAERLVRLGQLWIDGSRLGAAGLAAIVSSPHLGSLRILRINHDALDAGAGEALTAARLPALERLELADSGLPDGAIAALAGSELVHRVRVLDLRCNPLTAAAASEIVEAGPFHQMECLCLIGCKIGDEGVRTLARSDAFPVLKSLGLLHCGLTDSGAGEVVYARWADQLESLSMGDERISARGVDQLRTKFGPRLDFVR